jgi:transcriptional regulator with XRE-family HTH domain
MEHANLCGARIREARKKKGWGQVDLASALLLRFEIELHQSDISEIERQVRGIRDYELDAIARLLEVSPLWLLRGDETAVPEQE